MSYGNRNNVASASQAPSANIRRSSFNLSKTIKDTYQFDYLNPLWWEEVLPGDTLNVTVASFARLATQIVPILDNMYVDFFFFFVPNRLTYDKWEQLQGANIPDPDSSTDYILPKMTFPAGGPEVGTIFDKYGLPTDITNSWVLNNTLPLRGYQRIYNDWFRDENLQDSVPTSTDEGPDNPSEYALLKRGKRHDYFTSALSWPQKGPAVTLPLGLEAPVLASSGLRVSGFPDASPTMKGTTNPGSSRNFTGLIGSPSFEMGPGNWVDANQPLQWDDPKLSVTQTDINDPSGMGPVFTADLSEATSATINQLRQAFLMQQLFERDARGGTRYVEALKARFNVISPDFRLQRSEYLGGGSVTINTHPVAQTTPSEESPQANLAAFGTASSTPRDGIGFSKSFVEHGYVIGLVCARADITYQQGLDRKWNRSTRFDFFEPSLEQLGEQAILTKEIYLTGDTGVDESVFGYIPRYDEYRYSKSEIRGAFRSTYATTLDYWHLAQEFEGPPSLNSDFIQQSTPIERAIAVPSEPHLLMDAWIKVKAARPMSVNAIPARLGRF